VKSKKYYHQPTLRVYGEMEFPGDEEVIKM
jgi:hypothetical protein